MSKVYAFLATGFEEVECLAVVDLLRRASVEVIMVSIHETKAVTGAHNITVMADTVFSEMNGNGADVLFLPGGMPGTENLGAHEGLVSLLKNHYTEGKRICAICAAPSVLGTNHLLEGKKATCYPGFEDKLYGAIHVPDSVVTDGMITTSKGMGTAIDLGLELIRLLVSEEKAVSIQAGIQYENR